MPVTKFKDAKHVYNTLIKILQEQSKANPALAIKLTYKYNDQEFTVETLVHK